MKVHFPCLQKIIIHLHFKLNLHFTTLAPLAPKAGVKGAASCKITKGWGQAIDWILLCGLSARYGDGAGNIIEENSSVFSLIQVR